ncbi:uncharacterized protein LOC5521481 isoform X2 [Nematostella vectensis]|nr:uncharacterized protein LOC5521481 isoform X2 [Nematostella vectensis]
MTTNSIDETFYSTSPPEGFPITLSIDDGARIAQSTKYLKVITGLSPPFTLNHKSSVGMGMPFVVNASVQGPMATYSCNFGDGSPIKNSTNGFFEHVFSSEEEICISCNATNPIGDRLDKTSCVNVIERVEGFNLIEKIKPITLGSPAEITAEIFNGTNVNITFDCGDGPTSIHTLAIRGNMLDITVALLAFNYTRPGVYPINMFASNDVSSMSRLTYAIVEAPLTNLRYNTSWTTACLEVNGTLTIDVSVDGSNPQFQYLFNDSSFNTTGLQVTRVFSTFGLHSFNIIVRNNVSTVNTTVYVIVCKPVLLMNTSEVVSAPTNHTTPVVFNMTFDIGSDFSCAFDFGDGTDLTHHCFNYVYFEDNLSTDVTPFKNLKVSVNHTYTYEGHYIVQMNCSNRLSFTTASTVAIVEKPITDFSLPKLSPQIYAGTINLIWVMTAGSNVTFDVKLANIHIHTIKLTDTGGLFGLLERTHYFEVGLYVVSVNGSNLVSACSGEYVLTIQKDVTELDFQVTAKDSYIGPDVQGFGPSKNIFPVEYPINITVTPNRGTNLTYNFTLGYGPDQSLQEPTFVIQYPAPLAAPWYETYTIYVTAYNLVSNVTKAYTAIVHKTVKNLVLTNDGPTKQNLTMTFTLTIGDFGTDTCFVFDMKDGKSFHVFGSTRCESLDLPRPKVFTEIGVVPTITFTYVYYIIDEYFVTLNATNAVSAETVEVQAVCVKLVCLYPNITMRGVGPTPENATSVYRSNEIQSINDVEIYCEVSSRTTHQWKIYRQSEQNPQEFLPVDACGKPLDNAVLTIPRRCLNYGLYRIDISVYMADTVGVITRKSGYRRISSNPNLKAAIKGNVYVKIPYGQMITLDFRDSQDPDFEKGNFTDMKFYVLCRNTSESQFANLSHPPSIPVVQAPIRLNFTSQLDDRGGCLGTGAGRMNFTDNSTTVMTLDTREPGWTENKTYIFTLLIIKTNKHGTKTGTFDQTVELSLGDPPRLSTKCGQNCQRKVNTDQKLAIVGSCIECFGRLTFKWDLYRQLYCDLLITADPGYFIKIPDEDFKKMILTSIDGQNLVMKKDSLMPDTCYTLSYKAYRPSGIFGESKYMFLTNSPPENGTISFDRLNGTAMNTTFQIMIKDWNDVDPPIFYEASFKGYASYQVFSYTDKGNGSFMLPVGDANTNYTVQVRLRVIDSLGAGVSKYFNFTVEPSDISPAQTYSYLATLISDENSILNQAKQRGDMMALNQIISAASSLLNLLEEKDKELINSGRNITADEQAALNKAAAHREQLRTSFSTVLTDIYAYTVADVQMLSSSVAMVTEKYTEITNTAQAKLMTSFSNMLDALTIQSSQDVGFQAVKETVNTMLSGIAGLALGASGLASDNETSGLTNVTVGNTTVLKPLKDAAVDRCFQAISFLKTALQLTLSNMVAGESLVHFKTPILNATVGRVSIADMQEGFTLSDGLASFNLPLPESMGIDANLTGPNRFGHTDFIMPSFLKTPYAWMNSSSQIRSQSVGLSMTNSSGSPLNTSHFEDYVDIFIPRDASEVPEPEIKNMRPYKEGVYRQDQKFNLSSDEMSLHIELRPVNASHQYEACVRYRERPDLEQQPPVYIRKWTIPDFSSCQMRNITTERNGTNEVRPDELNVDRDCTQDPYTIHLSNSFLNDTGEYYLSILYYEIPPTEDPSTDAVPTDTPSRKKRAIPAGCKDHNGRMKRSCVFIPPPPPKPTTPPKHGSGGFAGYRAPNLDYNGQPFNTSQVPHYSIRVYSSNCLFFDEKNMTWVNNGCEVGNRTRIWKVHCECNHLTDFGSDFFVAPNPIDFDKVFSADLSENFLVITTVCGLFGLYLIAVIFARRADLRDKKKTGATPLPTNAPPGSTSYLLSIHTGVRQNAGTTADVSIVLTGEEGESQPTVLKDPSRPLFTRGADNNLVLTLPNSLGKLTHVRVWHDNDGSSPSWYLSRISVENMNTKERWYFICERWLAVEEDDGRVDRILPIASKQELTHFNHLFVSKTVKELGDGHLWFSIVTRPPQSVFTRVQRLSCCLSLLYCTMITSCMFYNTGGETNENYVIHIGSLSFDLRQMIIGLQSSLIVFPVNFALVHVFRSIRKEENEPVNKFKDVTADEGFDEISEVPISEAEQNEYEDVINKPEKASIIGEEQEAVEDKGKDFGSDDEPGSVSIGDDGTDLVKNDELEPEDKVDNSTQERAENREDKVKIDPGANDKPSENSQGKEEKKKKKGLHPNWRYLAWTTFVLSTLACSTFTVFYSLSWGPELANKWLLAFVMSFFQSVLLIQPIKVLCASIIFALIIKKPVDVDEEETELKEVPKHMREKSVQDLLREMEDEEDEIKKGPPDALHLLAARQKRLKEIQMSMILKEILAYFIFIAVLLLVAYGNRDPNAYLLRKTLVEEFVSLDESGVSLDEVGDGDSLWHWARETLIKNLYPGNLYNGKPDKYTGYLEDRVNYLVGISRLRLERVKNGSCTIPKEMDRFFDECYGEFSYSNSDSDDYEVEWMFLNKSAAPSARKRRSIAEQFSFVGERKTLTTYSDGIPESKGRSRRAVDPIYASTSGRQKRRKRIGTETKTYFVLDSAMLEDGSIQSCPTRWIYHNLLDLKGFPYWGKMNFYSGGGYPADLGYDYPTALTVVADLHSHNWVNSNTRGVFIEFAIYNANTNLFGVAFLYVEFLPTGGAFPHGEFKVARLYSYVGPFANFVLAMEVIMLLFMFYFVYREVKSMYKLKKKYFKGFWNWLEVAMIVLEFLMLGLFFARMWEVDKNFIELHHNPKDFVSFQYALASDETLNYVIGILVFFVTIRFIKLLRFNRRMALLGNTIALIAKPIGQFLISFTLVFISFAFFGNMIFGIGLDKFRSFTTTMMTQLNICLGDFDYLEMEEENRMLGRIYFFSFMYFIVMYLMNMFLAIINDSFSEVKTSNDDLKNEYEMVEFILDRFKSQIGINTQAPPQDGLKTPFGLEPDVPFWSYKHRASSICSDSEFSVVTNRKVYKMELSLSQMDKDLDVVLQKLSNHKRDDAREDAAIMKAICGDHIDDMNASSVSLNNSYVDVGSVA